MEGNVSIKVTKTLILRIISVVFACFFFIPTMLVSCGSYEITDDDLMKVELSAKTITFGTSVMGTEIDGAVWTIVSLIIPIAVFAILFIKHKAAIIVGALLTLGNNILYVMYGSVMKVKATESHVDFAYKPAFYILMIFFGAYYVLSILCLINNKNKESTSFQGGSANEFFGNLGQKISTTSQGAVQKTKDMASVMSLNNENAGLDRKNEFLQKQIGTEIYGQIFKDKSTEDVKNMAEDNTIPADLWNKVCDYVIKIKQNDLAKAENERKILELKGEMPCPKCGNMIPKEAVFCSKCGERSPYAEPKSSVVTNNTETAPKRMCSKCGKPLVDDAAFCKYCGSKVE